MSQLSFLEESERLARVDELGDNLRWIDEVVDWEMFRPQLEQRWHRPRGESPAGRKAWDVIVIFKMLVLCELHNISDHMVEKLVNDRLSFFRFLGLAHGQRPPDAKTLWAYRDRLDESDLPELMALFETQLAALGYAATGGQIIDSSTMRVPKQRRTAAEAALLKAGQVPPEWEQHPPKRRQKDGDAQWGVKHGRAEFGYKNHINTDAKYKLIRSFEVSSANVHDSQVLPKLLRPPNGSRSVWADRAYYGAATEQLLRERGLRSRILRRATRAGPLSVRDRRANRRNARVRARVEHVFGAMCNEMGGMALRCIGEVRATVRGGLRNLTYNMYRVVSLQRQAGAIA